MTLTTTISTPIQRTILLMMILTMVIFNDDHADANVINNATVDATVAGANILMMLLTLMQC